MAASLGKVALTVGKEYVIGLLYREKTIVTYNGNTYCSLKDTAETPSDDGVNWKLWLEGVPIATAETAGKVKPDGDTITVDADGTIHGASQVPEGVTFVDLEAETEELPEKVKVNADQLGGQNPEYYATAESVENVLRNSNTQKISSGDIAEIIPTLERDKLYTVTSDVTGMPKAHWYNMMLIGQDTNSLTILVSSLWAQEMYYSSFNNSNGLLEWKKLANADEYMQLSLSIATDANAEFLTRKQTVFRYNNATLNTPYTEGVSEGYSGGAIVSFSHSDIHGMQVAYPAGYKTIFFRSINGGIWSAWRALANAAEVLPLTGGTLTKDGTVETIRLNRPTGVATGGIGLCSGGVAVAAIYASSVDGHIKNYIPSSNTTYTMLDTGNSKRFIEDTTAPSDTTAAWIDTANKVIKSYIDGAWTPVS